MDPHECLTEIRTIIEELDRSSDVDDRAEIALQLAEKVAALDEWLSKGGFLPDQWERARGV